MNAKIYLYIGIMALVTYLIRVLPSSGQAEPTPEIKNRTIRSFLYYVPYVTLAVMTFPAILSATGSIYSAWAALIVGVLLAFKGRSLFQVAVFSCIVVFVLELFIC